MIRYKTMRVISGVVVVALAYSPILGHLTGTAAEAQVSQNTTSNFLHDAQDNLTQITDPLGHVTNIIYDPLNRIVQQTQPIPATGIARPTLNFTYDGLDQTSTIVDPRTLTTSYTNDGLGNQSVLTSPDTGVTSRTFDAAGNLLTSTDARGKVTTFTYDVLNRITSVAYSTGTPTLLEYDGGAAGASNAIGHLTKMTDESGQTTYSYDQSGRLLTKTQSTVSAAGTISRTVSYTYGSNGQLVSLTYPSGNQVNYTYDASGRINNITLNPSDSNGGTSSSAIVLLSQISYAPFGAAQGWVWGNNSISPNVYARTFDLDGRVVTYPLGNLAGATPGILRTVAYDAASHITAMTHTGNALASTYDQTFSYDGLDRLTGFVNHTGSQAYGYDANGNRTQFALGSSAYTNTISPTSNRLSTTNGPVPAKSDLFDGAGNLINDGTISYSYSDRGRLNGTVNGSVSTSYLYNGLGQRVSKTGTVVPTGSNFYVYDEHGRLLGEYDLNGAVLQETVFLGDMPLSILKQNSTGTPTTVVTSVYYVYADHINTPRIITDSATNNVVWSWVDTDPFGISPPNENPSGLGAFSYNVRFSGQLFDQETNNHYNVNRDYNPLTGRYVENDPIGLNGGFNTYGYVGGNPLINIDPLGLQIVVPVMPPPIILPPNPSSPNSNPYNPNVPTLGPNSPSILSPNPNLPTWDFPDWVYAAAGKPPSDASDPNGAKAPGQPGDNEGFCEPKKGPKWGRSPGGRGNGWIDSDGKVWVPTGPGADAHGGPHWDVQSPDGSYINVYPGGKRR